MAYIAYIRTNGDSLNVRSAPNGQIVGSLPNGSKVTVTGNPVTAGGLSWVPIGTNRWVASNYLSVPSVQGDATVVATRTANTIGGGLRVYKTQLIDGNGNVINTVRGISGRVGKQIPSHTAGSQTPLPFGTYKFDSPGYVDFSAGGEFGGVWSPVTPTFSTGRSGIGIHYDPSCFANSSQTGTSGCFATPTQEERDIMTQFIQTYKPVYFIVQEGK